MNCKKVTKYFNFETFLFFLISSSIFITSGENLLDYKKLIFLKIILICLIYYKVNYLNQILYFSKKYKTISILICLFILIITTSFLFSPFKINEFGYIWLRTRYLNIITDIFFFISLFLFFNSIKIDFVKLVNFFIVPGIIYSIYLIIKIIILKDIISHPDTFLFFDGSRTTGMLFVCYISIYLGYTATSLKNYYIIKNIFVFTLLFTIILLLRGRASILSIVATHLALLFIFIKNNKKINMSIIVFIFSAIISFFLSQGILEIIQNFDGIKNIKPAHNFGSDKKLFFIQDRIELWKYAFEKFSDYPFFGLGPGGFFISSFNELMADNNTFYYNTAHTHPHNFIMQFLIEWGLGGSIVFIFLLTILFIKSFKGVLLHKNYLLLIPGLNMISITIYGLFDGTFFHPTFTFLIALSLSLLSSEIYKKNKFGI